MNSLDGLYIVGLAALAGYLIVGRVPSVLHVSLLCGSNFLHGIVLVGAMFALSSAEGVVQLTSGFLAVMLSAANATGGFIVTDRLLASFERGTRRGARTDDRDVVDGSDERT